jgi:O-methyltransferase domain/Dimerisation domain
MAEIAAGKAPLVIPQEHILEIIRGFWQSRALAMAAELEIADHLADGPLAVEILAERTETHAPSLFRLMRALESVGLFKRVSPRVFANTPASECLQKNVPGSLRAFVRTILSKGFGQYDAWGDVLTSVRTGQAAFEQLYGCGPWEFFHRNPEIWGVFNQAMRAASALITPIVAASYNWRRFPVIADIGGGIGSQLVAILDAHPSSRGILFDQPGVLAEAIPHARVERVAGDFFEGVPPGADAYTMRWIMHDWQDPQAIAILRNIRKAAAQESSVVLIEEIIPDTPELTWGKWIDLHMMTVTGGRERTISEYVELFAKSGFELEKVVPMLIGGASLIIGRPQP